ncbi:L-aspartate oxidase [Chthonomonas calidirosea]|uniref:L-aspartate oxidase n=1 Tax=Chthonomonas calidirosea TaxID=454171 RepID=UPI0006DD3C89|nr:L-aspartate oxidase [Chthonomonas calidirosea]CEK12817.1 L-aspartate oxidase [Chthonomonas calidirosea]
MKVLDTDYLVIGSGLAGLTYALRLAPHGHVTVLTKRSRTDANSSWAQGGIAGALGEDDSLELHLQDTLVAGAGLCHPDAVEILVCEGPERIRDLIRLGAHFNTEIGPSGEEVLSLGREGGHSRNRIVHTADYTGWECERTLLEAVRNAPSVEILEHYFACELLVRSIGHANVCVGVLALEEQTGDYVAFRTRATLLATGGCGQVYEHTTNPSVATGDGVAMAWRAGVPIANMEFIQFHPTTLYHPKARAFLITEALRGEGGRLCHKDGETFMERYHPLKELAPRDVVARAIVSEMQRREVDCVYLDATHIPEEKLKHHFPTIYARCLEVGIDITRDLIPIAPAQHYQCGGVVTDLYGATPIARLYAAGEVACTGVHGANRLASNSLLEAMVFGYRAAEHTLRCASVPLSEEERSFRWLAEPAKVSTGDAEADKEVVRQCKRLMQRNVGIVRTTVGLLQAREALAAALERFGADRPSTVEQWEARNVVQVGWLIVESALRRHESRGLHYVLDYPEPVESERHDTVLINKMS